ncbi:MAG: hypothetical protein GXO85_02295 [Chlorobi bacterium]|nr:hypothetical protein [Chlorobiota bacterium]
MKFEVHACSTIEGILENDVFTPKKNIIKLFADQIALNECTNSDGSLNLIGREVLSKTLASGLVTNIHFCQKYNIWNEAAHLRYVIDMIERGYAQANIKVKGQKNNQKSIS